MKKIIIGAAVAAILTTGAVAADKTFSELTNSDMKYMIHSRNKKCKLSGDNIKEQLTKYFTKNKIIKQAHVPTGSIYIVDFLMSSGKVLYNIFFTNLETCKAFIKNGKLGN